MRLLCGEMRSEELTSVEVRSKEVKSENRSFLHGLTSTICLVVLIRNSHTCPQILRWINVRKIKSRNG